MVIFPFVKEKIIRQNEDNKSYNETVSAYNEKKGNF